MSKKVLNSKLNEVNTCAGVTHWGKDELQKLDRKTSKLLTMCKAYVKRKRGKRGLISVEDAANIELNRLTKYVFDSEEALLNEVRTEALVVPGKGKKEIELEIKNTHRKKALSGRHFGMVEKTGLKKKTEKIIMAAQEQALGTTNIRKVNDKINRMCRMCGEGERRW